MRKRDILALIPKKYRKPAAIILALVVALIGVSGSSFLEGTVINVADGDTVTLLEKYVTSTKIRLYGIDAPEKNQAFGREAGTRLEDLVLYKHVSIISHQTDKYGRKTALIFLPDGSCVNEILVKEGYAWVYRQYCTSRECQRWIELEKKAKSQKKGLWGRKAPTPPWEWRRQRQ